MPEIDCNRVHRERFTGNQTRPELRQLAFRFRREIPVEMFGYDELQYGAPENLHPLIIEMAPMRLVPQTWMSERFCEKQRIAKLVTDPFFQRVHSTEC